MTAAKFQSVAAEVCQSNEYSDPTYLGAGQFKEVFQSNTPSETTVAVKVFNPERCNLARAEREIAAMLQCESPVIGKLYNWGVHDHDQIEHLYTVEEFFAGGTLSSRLESFLGDRQKVCNHGLHLVRAVSHLRDAGLVHRDIKPDNIMFRNQDDQVALVDFGLVRNLSGTSLTHTFLPQGPGTPYFASPEQLNNEKSMIDWRSDQFSIGVVLSICIFGAHPYSIPGKTDMETVNQVCSRGSHSDAFLEETEKLGMEFLRDMTAGWPVQRFGNPTEIKDALETVLEGNTQ